jgi:hypothetical protein
MWAVWAPILLDRPLSISDDSFQPVIAGTDVPVVVISTPTGAALQNDGPDPG